MGNEFRPGSATDITGPPLRLEGEAANLEREVAQRHETLQRDVKALEERKQRVLDSLRDLAAQLDEALAEPTEEDESLLEALDVERTR